MTIAEYSCCTLAILQLQSSDGCYTFNITGTELGLHDWDVAPNSVVMFAFVTEQGTNSTQNATSVSSVIHQALKLEFLPHSAQYFKPGLPYRGKVKMVHYILSILLPLNLSFFFILIKIIIENAFVEMQDVIKYYFLFKIYPRRIYNSRIVLYSYLVQISYI